MADPIEQGRGELFISRDLHPFAKRKVRRQNRGTTLVAIRKQVEEQLATGLVERDKAQFIQDQQVGTLEALPQAAENALVTRHPPPHWSGASSCVMLRA
jgi:hypothetical protein